MGKEKEEKDNSMKYRVYVDETKKRRDGQSPVVLIFEDSGKRFKIATGLLSSVKFTGREFPENEPNHKVKTMVLCRKLLKIDGYLIENEYASISRVRDAVKEILGRSEKKKPLTDYLEDAAKGRGESTAKSYLSTAKKVRAFDPGACFDTVDAEWLEKFDKFLQVNGCKAINGRAVHLRCLKAVFNKAIDNEITSRYPFRKFKIQTEMVAINNLTVEQLRRLRDCKVQPQHEIYRDLFMLSFYLCGINPKDLLNLTNENVKNGRIVYTRHKTHKLYNIPLPNEAKAIFERYKGKEHLLSVMDSCDRYLRFVAKWDDNLRRVGEKRGEPILPNVTVYSARYTFASIGAELEIPRETIALCLGHSWADVTAHYISYDLKRIDDAVRKIIDYVNSDLKAS